MITKAKYTSWLSPSCSKRLKKLPALASRSIASSSSSLSLGGYFWVRFLESSFQLIEVAYARDVNEYLQTPGTV